MSLLNIDAFAKCRSISSFETNGTPYYPTRNICVGDVVVLLEDKLIPTKWPIARVVETHPGKDGLVRVATMKTATGTYKRPTTKLALLVPLQE